MTKKTGRAAYLCYTRRETFTNGSPRHQIQMRVPIGVDRDGTINATDLHALSNAGAYGGHGPTTIGMVGHKSLSLYGKPTPWEREPTGATEPRRGFCGGIGGEWTGGGSCFCAPGRISVLFCVRPALYDGGAPALLFGRIL